MTIDLELARRVGDPPAATLTWDEETGEVSGPAAGLVTRMAESALRAGWVISHPWPTEYKIEVDPLRDRRAVAALGRP